MTTKTIRLERSAYELLQSRKWPGESFSEEVRRIVGGPRPSLKSFLDIVAPGRGRALADAIEAIRAEDLRVERSRGRHVRGNHGPRA